VAQPFRRGHGNRIELTATTEGSNPAARRPPPARVARAAGVVTCVLLLVPAGPVRAQRQEQTNGVIDPEAMPRPAASATRVNARLRIDGKLDEAAWREAVPISNFVQSQPDAGYPPTEPTVVRVIYDERGLYIGALCYDSNPDELVITSLEQDFGVGGSTRDMDIFAVTLDTFLDRRSSFIFLVSPGGAYRDGQTFNDSRQVDFAWRAVVDIETTVHDSGYTVEMGIPWTSLRFDAERGVQDWGLNILRRVRRKNEDTYWAPVDRRDPVHRMSKAGTLTGLSDLRSGRNLTVKPFTLASAVGGSELEELDADGVEADAGGDIKWGVTPGLTLDGTVRTDFSQVEVDQEQVNLTRFPLFFPERRDFFVENSGSFVLGDVAERNYRTGSSLREFTLFHSRRIGLADGRPIPIVAGGRLTGRLGGFEVGLLNIQTESEHGLPAENVGVARLRSNFGGSDVGVMFINREATGALDDGGYNRSAGADANFRLFDYMIVNSYVALTDEPGITGNRWSGRVAVGWRDRTWDASAFYKHVGDGFNPGVGFVRRTGVRHGYATVGAHTRPPVRFLQEVNPYGEFHHVTNLDGEVVTRRGAVAVSTQFRDGSRFDVEFQNRFERLFALDSIGGVPLLPGDYTTNDASVSYSSSLARPLSGSLTVAGGGFWDGTSYSVSATGNWRVHYRLMFDVSASHNDVNLAGGNFIADVFGWRTRFAYSTDVFASAFVQYNTQSEQLITNVRLNWTYAPLSDVFVVFTMRRDMSDTGMGVLDRSVTVKLTKLLSF
jgi:hypothetical protein